MYIGGVGREGSVYKKAIMTICGGLHRVHWEYSIEYIVTQIVQNNVLWPPSRCIGQLSMYSG